MFKRENIKEIINIPTYLSKQKIIDEFKEDILELKEIFKI